MKYLFSYKIFENEKTRTKPLTQDEFVQLFKSNCTQFNFENDQLYRGCGDLGEFALYKEKERLSTYGDNYPYHDFFNARKEYPVPRFKSTIGSTSILAACVLGEMSTSVYLVIPFDNSKIILCPAPDMAMGALGQKDIKYSDDMFEMIEYSSNFQIDKKKIQQNFDLLAKQTGRSISIEKAGIEFFTNSDCLLYKIGDIKNINPSGRNIQQNLVNDRINHLKRLIK